MKIVKKNKTYFLNFDNDTESNDLDNYANKDLEIKVITDNVISFIVKDKSSLNPGQAKPVIKPSPSIEDIKRKIIEILQDKDLPFKEKVEGTFETLLKPADLLVFKEMLNNKEIITYKQSDKYKKAIYVVNEEKPVVTKGKEIEKPQSQQSKALEKENSEEAIKGFLKKKFAILKTAETADKFSKEFYTKFKNNEIKGQKSFDGNFYVIDVYLYGNTLKQIMSSGMSKSFSIEELGAKLNKDAELLKVVIEFLKEEGVIIEKKRNIYCLV